MTPHAQSRAGDCEEGRGLAPTVARALAAALGLLGASCTVSFQQGGPGTGDGGVDPLCGNGVLDPGELCDDGNNADGDDCRHDCRQDFTRCGDGLPDPGETCDDGNRVPGDGCDERCQAEYCDETVCPSGCCTEAGECLEGFENGQCGTGGQACLDCNLEGEVCEAQACQNLGSCTPGDTRACDNCGQRTCDSSGQWGACVSAGECSPGVLESGGACGTCGTFQRTCGLDCAWGAYQCVGEGVCAAGLTEQGGPCGACGTEQRTCGQDCQWPAWSCVGQGACNPGAVQQGSACGLCGH